MLNRQIGLLFLVGLAIAMAGVAAAMASPGPARLATSEATGAAWRPLLVVAAVLVAGSQVLVTRSALKALGRGGNGSLAPQTNRGLELLWSILPGMMVLAAVVYVFVR